MEPEILSSISLKALFTFPNEYSSSVVDIALPVKNTSNSASAVDVPLASSLFFLINAVLNSTT